MHKSIEELWYEDVTAAMPFVVSKKGYAIIYVPKCPIAWKSGKLARCRYVAYAMGWLVDPGNQQVHHKNFDKLDDRPANLEAVTVERHKEIHEIRPPGTGAKISAALKGRIITPEHREKIRATLLERYAAGEISVTISEEQKEAIRRSLIGKKHTEERRRNQSEAHKGIRLSDEAKAKVSAAMKGRSITWGDKLSAALKGRKPSDKCYAARLVAIRGKPLSDEHKAKLSEKSRIAMKRIWAERKASRA